MKTPTTIEALEGAIEMLEAIQRGKSYGMVEFFERLHAYTGARDEHRRLEMIAERNRAAVREMSSKKRGVQA